MCAASTAGGEREVAGCADAAMSEVGPVCSGGMHLRSRSCAPDLQMQVPTWLQYIPSRVTSGPGHMRSLSAVGTERRPLETPGLRRRACVPSPAQTYRRRLRQPLRPKAWGLRSRGINGSSSLPDLITACQPVTGKPDATVEQFYPKRHPTHYLRTLRLQSGRRAFTPSSRAFSVRPFQSREETNSFSTLIGRASARR